LRLGQNELTGMHDWWMPAQNSLSGQGYRFETVNGLSSYIGWWGADGQSGGIGQASNSWTNWGIFKANEAWAGIDKMMAELAAQNARFEEAKSQGKEVYNSSTDGRSGIDPYGATAIGYDIISGNWLAYAIADADPTWKQAWDAYSGIFSEAIENIKRSINNGYGILVTGGIGYHDVLSWRNGRISFEINIKDFLPSKDDYLNTTLGLSDYNDATFPIVRINGDSIFYLPKSYGTFRVGDTVFLPNAVGVAFGDTLKIFNEGKGPWPKIGL